MNKFENYKRIFVVAGLRRLSYKWYARSKAMTKARIKRGLYSCAKCGKEFKRKEIQVDHKRPVIGKMGFVDFREYIDRLFVKPSGLQVLCKPCHKKKTDGENSRRLR